MGERTAISWCDHTFNPWWGVKEPRVRTSAANWQLPWRWHRKAEGAERRPRVFCGSMCDVFDNQVPREWRHDLWARIRFTRNLEWLLLTKRPQNILEMLPTDWFDGWPHVRLGVTVENQAEAERRVPVLMRVPQALGGFLSCEPLLGPLDSRWIAAGDCGHLDALDGVLYHDDDGSEWYGDANGVCARPIAWVIAGGESGPRARTMDLEWARGLMQQCHHAGAAFWFKQAGGRGHDKGGDRLDGERHQAFPDE